MDMIYFIIWMVISSMGLLIFPIDKKIEKMDDSSPLKKWWRKNVVSLDPDDEKYGRRD
jgi:nitrate reductase gamma subunit